MKPKASKRFAEYRGGGCACCRFQLRAVEHDIKGLGADKLGAGFDVLKILRIGHGKGVVHGDIALFVWEYSNMGKSVTNKNR